MTAEERFIKIENNIQAITEIQAKHESAIRDLIIASRTFLESQKETTAQMQAMRGGQQDLRDMQQTTDRTLAQLDQKLKELAADSKERLNALIQVVDRIIRKENDKS